MNEMLLLQSAGSDVWLPLEFKIILMIVFTIVILALTISGILGRYRRIPPDRALILYGGGEFRALTGGAVIVWPIINEAYDIDLRAFQIELDLANAPNVDRIPINIKAMATCKISKEESLLKKAAEAFGRSSMEEIQEKVRNVMEGHLRVVVGQISMDTILSERDLFNAKIQSEAATELQNLGIEVTILNILEVTDDNGVIAALGKPMIARIKAEAAIQEAEQTRRQTIETTTAEREGATTRAQNETAIAQALRDKEMKTSEYDAQVRRQQAMTAQAGPLADAGARKSVVEAEVAVQCARTEAEIGLQDAVRRRNESELQATLVTQATAERQKTIIVAKAESEARTMRAEAERASRQLEGEGEARKTRSIGLANAEIKRQQGLAEAAACQAMLLATAEGTRAEALAKAAGIEAELSAQATGRKQLVEAFAGMDDEQRKLLLTTMLLDRLPQVIAALGGAGERIMRPIAETVTASLGQIDNLTVYDSAAGRDGDGSLKRVMTVGPEVLFTSLQQIKALGLMPMLESVLDKAGIDLAGLGPANLQLSVDTDGTGTAGSSLSAPS